MYFFHTDTSLPDTYCTSMRKGTLIIQQVYLKANID